MMRRVRSDSRYSLSSLDIIDIWQGLEEETFLDLAHLFVVRGSHERVVVVESGIASAFAQQLSSFNRY